MELELDIREVIMKQSEGDLIGENLLASKYSIPNSRFQIACSAQQRNNKQSVTQENVYFPNRPITPLNLSKSQVFQKQQAQQSSPLSKNFSTPTFKNSYRNGYIFFSLAHANPITLLI